MPSSSFANLDTLIQDFSPEKFVGFLRGASGAFKPAQIDLSDLLEEGGQFSQLQQLGRIDFDEVQRLRVVVCKVDNELTSRTGKQNQYELAKRVLQRDRSFDGGLFAFYDQAGHFRLSLVVGQAAGTKRAFTSFRRYTYFVSKDLANKTFKNQLRQPDAFASIERMLKTFSIEAVSDEFYKEFQPKFEALCDSVTGKAHESIKRDFALLFVIRVLFLGFVQKRKWLGGRSEFIQDFWQEYQASSNRADTFYKDWLKPVLFEALNSPPGQVVSYGKAPFSEQTKLDLQMAPYLNGELFKPRPGMDDSGLFIPDQQIGEFFDFLFRYNFTVEENTLYDEELELNPEFLGIIFERLVNQADGAVYTPRPEVDLMCRLALVKWLEKQGAASVENLYNLLFRNVGSQEEHDADQRQGDFTPAEIEHIVKLLERVTVCDPAAGSGAFEVGMLQVLEEVLENLYDRNNTPASLTQNKPGRFERKKTIIANSLYGVEVKRWAVWINQLRLWLTLFVDMPDEYKISMTPLLPNLGFKVRVGDSLVQRIGSRSFPIHGHAGLPATIKTKVTKLKGLKADFFYNRTDNYTAIENAEVQLFSEILDIEIDNLQKQLNALLRPREKQAELFETGKQQEMDLETLQAVERNKLQTEIANLKQQKRDLKQERPFLWSLEFAEVFFEGEGFDIIIGNPPYVRQEQISDPNGGINNADYKTALLDMVLLDFPDYFAKSKVETNKFRKGRKPAGQSDLYVYFYIRSLRLLSPKGIHVFICSNSWLDVGYGVWLQEFLLRNAPVHLVIDNHARRSFANADINTIISVIDAPTKHVDQDHKARFVAFKQPFDSTVSAENLLAIIRAKEVIKNDALRVYPLSISELVAEGTQVGEDGLGKSTYVGQKWGGIYLRAPEIYFTIMQKARGKMVKLGDLADVRRGITTGANDFFYLQSVGKGSKSGLMRVRNGAGWEGEIEKEYLKPVLTTLQEIENYSATEKDVSLLLFVCDKEKSFLKEKTPAAEKYILWGEGRGFNARASVRHRRLWWSVPKQTGAHFIAMRFRDQRNWFPIVEGGFWIGDTVFIGTIYNEFPLDATLLVLNSTFLILMTEIYGRKNLGQGLLTTYGPDLLPLPCPDPRLIVADKKALKHLKTQKVQSVFVELGIDPDLSTPIFSQSPNPVVVRKEIDNLIAEALELSQEDMRALYTATCTLILDRTRRALSF